ncbi:hypothetical protein JGH11_03015 [Dysgonomonas sp. Marseille-P4677]|uniref:helix-turn-helix and ligand-binding sensor domain-containing protein n=1 Tax=Dysgonomonas sp. Marseille-P4677 TaxID=2364790 RepID=UPI001913CFB1|nr:triple tyrosine motif-containing protein [Dysgonomonas sp. Marseille-P4677]MBK5719837.1 hypothetical protein [Dysgonomonas sp. Marseille-P4677]
MHLITLLCVSLIGYSKNPYIHNLDKQLYGAASKNWNIKEDDKGFIYVANESGLLEFDGIKWNLYRLPGNQPIKSICVENHNCIYTGNVEGFGRWDREHSGKLMYTHLSKDVPEKNIMYGDFWQSWKHDNAIYFQSFKSIFRYKDSRVEKVNITKPVLFLLPAGDELWVQYMKGGLYRVNGLELELLVGTDKLKNTDVRVILPYQDNKYLIGTSNSGIFIYNNKELIKWDSPISDAVQVGELNCGIRTKNGKYLLGTILEGIYEADVNGQILNHFSTGNQLMNNTILSLFESKLGSVWIGYDSGLGNMQYWDNLDYFTFGQNKIGTIYDAKIWDGRLFLCTNQGIYYISQKDFFGSKSLNNIKLIDNTQGQAWKLTESNGRLFCAHNRGIIEISKKLRTSIFSENNNGVFNFQEEHLFEKNVSIASMYNKCLIIDGNQRIEVGIQNIPVKYVMTDYLNNLWLKIPYKGVYKLRLNQDFSIAANTYFGGDKQFNFHENINMLKIGSRIVLSNDSLFYTYDEISNKIEPNTILNNCLASVKSIQNIVKQKKHHYWIITNKSVYLLYYDGVKALIMDQYFLGNHRLSLVERFENVSIINDTLSLICLDNGFLLHTMDRKPTYSLPTSPIILNISGTDRNGNTEYNNLMLNKDSIITIKSSYANLVQVKVFNPNSFYQDEYFQFKLKGIDSDWSKSHKSDIISFERLPSGRYTLFVRTINQLEETSEPYQIDLIIEKPFCKSTIAIISYFIIACTLFWIIWKLVLRHHRNLHIQKIRSRERNRLKYQNLQLEKKINQVNAELFTRANLILQKNKLVDDIREIINNQYYGKDKKDISELYRKLKNLLKTGEKNEDQWEIILITFEEKHPDFFMKLKKISPDITPNDLKICMCLRLNYDSKEIAQMLNLSVRTVENNRSKIRKKLNIPSNIHLTDFLLDL